jgi:hypothetical protein
MVPRANLIIDQGSDFVIDITVADENGNIFDITDFTVASQVRKHYTSANSVSFVTLVANAEAGVFTLSMNAHTTSMLTAGRYVYDVELTSSAGLITRVLEGQVTVTPEVTR